MDNEKIYIHIYLFENFNADLFEENKHIIVKMNSSIVSKRKKKQSLYEVLATTLIRRQTKRQTLNHHNFKIQTKRKTSSSQKKKNLSSIHWNELRQQASILLTMQNILIQGCEV